MPTTTENKVRFNLKNVYYAKWNGTTYETPVAVKGAVSLDLSPEGEMTKFYADGIAYYVSSANNGYSGSIELARIPDAMYKDIWGWTEGTTSKVLTENAKTEPAVIALLYQIDGDTDDELYCLYAVTLGRPSVGSKTNEATKDPQTQSCDIAAVPMDDGKVLARTTHATPTATKTGWFSSVFTESGGTGTP